MSPLVDPAADAYAEAHTTPPPEPLRELAEETRRTLPSPGMMVGPVEGRFLELLVYALRARQILEIGTFSGYSALSMAAGLPYNGRIVTCEVDPAAARVARRAFEASPYADRIELRVGPALDTVATLGGPFDFVFVDADKAAYPDYFEAVLPKLARHGLMAFDNTLWSGRVIGDEDTDADSVALRTLNDALAADPRVVCVQLTVRDGVTLVRRA